MKQQFLLTGEHTAYRVESGTVELYAVQLADGQPSGRLHHFKTVDTGEVFLDYCCVQTRTAVWACMVKCAEQSDCVRVFVGSGNAGDLNEFTQFVGAVEEGIQKDAVLLRKRSGYARRVLSMASARLVKMKAQPSKSLYEDFHDENEWIEVCKVLCHYLKTEPKLPSQDIAEYSENPAEEMLYLSGVRYKKISLPEAWWKHSNGAMLGLLEDGSPVALMPCGISGYRAYDPKTHTAVQVDDIFAARVQPEATAVFRTFPSKRVGIADIAGFILGENIRKELVIVVLCGLISTVIQIIPPFVTAQIFNVMIPENLRGILVEVIGVLIAFGLANIGFFILLNLGVSRIDTKGWLSVQAALWDRLFSLHISFFHQFTKGELLQKIKGIERAKLLLSKENLQIIFANAFFFMYIIALCYFNAQITLYVLLMYLCLILIYWVSGKKKYRLYQRYTDLENKSTSFYHQWVRGMHRIKASCAEERVFDIWSAYEADKHKLESRIKRIDNALEAVQMFFDFAAISVVYFLIAQVPDVAMGLFIAYTSTFLILQQAMRKLLGALSVLPELAAVCSNIQPILDAIPEYSAVKTVPADMDGTLEVNHAAFRYEEQGRLVLDDVSFRVEEGESIGIVGLSGAGKSTLLRLLMGFYDLHAGKIYYGGYELETIDLRYLRKQMGVVLQNGKLAVGDLYGSITDHDTGISHAAVLNAIRTVGLEELVASLPDGLHTRLERCPLSGEEQQRLLIARAIVKNPKFIFLDEAVDSLDNLSQERIWQSLKEIPATKIMVAQRMETVRHCDKMIVLENGQITQYDSYDEMAGSHESHEQPVSFAGQG